MKKKIKMIIGCLIIITIVFCNVSSIMDRDQIATFFLSEIEALASVDQGESVIGKKHQIQAGCNGESFAHFRQVCCRGSSLSCVDKCPTGVIYNGCSTHGRLPL